LVMVVTRARSAEGRGDAASLDAGALDDAGAWDEGEAPEGGAGCSQPTTVARANRPQASQARGRGAEFERRLGREERGEGTDRGVDGMLRSKARGLSFVERAAASYDKESAGS